MYYREGYSPARLNVSVSSNGVRRTCGSYIFLPLVQTNQSRNIHAAYLEFISSLRLSTRWRQAQGGYWSDHFTPQAHPAVAIPVSDLSKIEYQNKS